MGDGQQETTRSQHLEQVMSLFREIGRLDTTVDYESSFKVVRGELLENRFLLGVGRSPEWPARDEQLDIICQRLGMPDELRGAMQRQRPRANHVYFGVEKNGAALLLKVYLEFRDALEREGSSQIPPGASCRLFTGFKWEADQPDRQSVTCYDWMPSLSVAGMIERLEKILGAETHQGLLLAAQTMLETAIAKNEDSSRPPAIQFLEVWEERNPRRSFDINFYRSDLRVGELWPQLSQLLRHARIPEERQEALATRLEAARFGHLAGGVTREGDTFVTVYYGARELHSSQFASATIASGR